MENLVGKKLKYKGTNDIKIVKEVKNNRVYFTDNGTVDLGKLYESFEEAVVPSTNTMNPDTFFEPNFGNLLNQIDDYKKDPESFTKKSKMERGEDNEAPVILNGQDVSGLDPKTIAWMKEQERQQKEALHNKGNVNNDDHFMKQFGSTEKVHKVDDLNEELENVRRANSGETINTNTNTNSNNTSSKSNNRLPEMKKSFKIKLNIELDEYIPKVEDIRAVERLFDISLIDDIAKEIANKYLNDRRLFEGMVLSELDRIINKKKKVVKKKVVKKTEVK